MGSHGSATVAWLGKKHESSVDSLDVLKHSNMTRLELEKTPSGHRGWSYKLVRRRGSSLPAGSMSPEDSGNAILESGSAGTTERTFPQKVFEVV